MGLQGLLIVGLQQVTTACQLQERDALLDRTACDPEKVFTVGLREAAIAFGNVGGDRNGGAVELVDEEPVAASELFGSGTDGVREVDSLLVDEQLFEGERGKLTPDERVERRK